MVQSVVDEVVQRVQAGVRQVATLSPQEMIGNRWVQLGVAVAVGYVLGRTRNPIRLGGFTRQIATTAFTSLVSAAMAAARDPERMKN
jgi:hypothetical protein